MFNGAVSSSRFARHGTTVVSFHERTRDKEKRERERKQERESEKEEAGALRACFARCLFTRLTLVSREEPRAGYVTFPVTGPRRVASSPRSYLAPDYAKDSSFRAAEGRE